jgi:signal transduction histidine kinase
LANLEQRARTFGGTFVLEPVRGDGSGTRITWTASLDAAPALQP